MAKSKKKNNTTKSTATATTAVASHDDTRTACSSNKKLLSKQDTGGTASTTISHDDNSSSSSSSSNSSSNSSKGPSSLKTSLLLPPATTPSEAAVENKQVFVLVQESTENNNAAAAVAAPAARPYVTLKARPTGPKCPFGYNDGSDVQVEFALYPGGCVHLKGPSGIGKSTLAMSLAGLTSPAVLHTLDMALDITWDASLPQQERCGVLFQQTTLLDELTVAGNLALALEQNYKNNNNKNSNNPNDENSLHKDIQYWLELVGLDYHRDGNKRVTELSGGMARRASMALQLAQHKHCIILDEPFTGLDAEAAVAVVNCLVHIRKTCLTALVLISHEPHLAAMLMDPQRNTQHNLTVDMTPPDLQLKLQEQDVNAHAHAKKHASVTGTTFRDRFVERVVDYTAYSFPLIALAMTATGLAIAMLSADLLQRLDVTQPVLQLVEQEVKPMIQLLTGQEPNIFTMMAVKAKVRSMLHATVPTAKANLFCIGMTKLMVLEVGPLLTALLLAGRMGGSYAGRIATLQATRQNALLQTLGVSPRQWSLYPALCAALVAAPILTVTGTVLALAWASWIGPHYNILPENDDNDGIVSSYFWTQVRKTVFPVLRLRNVAGWWNEGQQEQQDNVVHDWWDIRTLNNNKDAPGWDTLIEIVTWPPVYHILKSIVFIGIIILTAEWAVYGSALLWPYNLLVRLVRRQSSSSSVFSQSTLTPRRVPIVITTAVVWAGLLVIVADWAFSQLLLLRV